jgi:predicted RNA-binding Zn-ribbon protein involved in translation (DUF1610 family)
MEDIPNVAVNCRSCGKAIPFVKPERPAPELSLRCPACDRRMIYAAADVRPFSAPSARRPGSGELSGKKRWLWG